MSEVSEVSELAKFHVLFLKGHLSDPMWLQDLVDQGVLRSWALLLDGPYAALAVGSYTALTSPPASADADADPTLEQAYRLICPSDDQPPCNSVVMQTIRGTVSMLESKAFVVFALVELRRGSARRWKGHVADLPAAAGVTEAVALGFGLAGVDAVVELVSDDLDALHERLLAYTDLEEVVSVEVLYTGAIRNRGFVSMPAG